MTQKDLKVLKGDICILHILVTPKKAKSDPQLSGARVRELSGSRAALHVDSMVVLLLHALLTLKSLK